MERHSLVERRRRGTALVDTPSGILLVSENGKRFSLPGGGARHHESRETAAIRELEEETGLKATDSSFLFEHLGPIHRTYSGRGYYRDAHKVFLIVSAGVAKPRKEIKALAYSNTPGIQLTTATKDIVEKYQKIKSPAKLTALTCEKDGAPLKLKEHATFIQCEYCKTIYYKGDFFGA